GQTTEWAHEGSLEWHLTQYPLHSGVQTLLNKLNEIYKTEKAFYELACKDEGFEWVDFNDSANSVISFLRKGKSDNDQVLVVCNFTPAPRENYRLGISQKGTWVEILNSDATIFGGSGMQHNDVVLTEELPVHGRENSVSLT